MALVIAHRGASAYETENSLAAFRLARAQGADGVELDVHVTADGMPVVHHDPVVAGQSIAASRWADLEGIELANGETLPTLVAALDTLGADLGAYVEVKHLAPEHDGALLEVLQQCPAPDNCRVHSFDHALVRRLRERNAGLRVGILAVARPVSPFIALEDARAGVLWQQESLVDAALVEGAHQRGYSVFAWTVDEPERMRELLAMNVDAICSNRPDVAREVVG